MTRLRMACIAIVLSTALSGCASSLRQDSPDDLYAQLLESTSWPRCTPNDDADREEARGEQIKTRFETVRPWLEQQIGREEIDRIYAANQQSLEEISFIGCPRKNFSAWQDMTVRRVLREMERRQRSAARLTPPLAPHPSDTGQ